MTEQIATGAPKPARASRSAPKQKATASAWTRGRRGQSAERAAQDVEVPGADGHPVHPQGVDDDPQDGDDPEDGKDAEDGALRGAGERLADRHARMRAGDQCGRQEAGQTR
jgi:hypothetical protein